MASTEKRIQTQDNDQLENHLLPQFEKSQTFFWHRLRNHLVWSVLPAKRPLRLVDVGAGAGILGQYLSRADSGVEYSFIEPLESLNAMLARRYGERADASKKPDLKDFDAVALLDVLEHQDDDRGFLRDLVNKCRKGARIIVTVPALPLLWSVWDDKLGHRRRYTARTLASAAEGLSVRRLELSYVFPELVLPALARKSLGSESSSEFPDLPDWMNRLLYGVGRMFLPLRRLYPFGSSLVMILEVR